MWPFKRVPKPSPKRLIELEMAIDEVKVTLSWLKKSVVDLNARFATIARQAKAAEPAEPAEPAPERGLPFPNARRGW